MSTGEENGRGGKRRWALGALTALGIVFGDIGTSPLYALRECFYGSHALEPSAGNVLGVTSLILWSLALIVCVKYLGFILRMDNHGEGGIFALLALLRGEQGRARWQRGLLVMGLFGGCLLYADGTLTPSISVLSAVEGLGVSSERLAPLVVPLACVILVVLFAVQRLGTARVGVAFGPVMLLWFAAIGLLGLAQIVRTPGILQGVWPWQAVLFLAGHPVLGVVVMGSVFLVLTGAEALYADLGHFGRRPIRTAWYVVALPALVLNYLGQAALLLEHPEARENPFYLLVPEPLRLPMVVLATAAAVIASQALITGTYSLTMQAVQMGFIPRMQILHTSESTRGQIYIPFVNWLLMGFCLGLVSIAGSSSALAGAYGIAIAATMVVTTLLFVMAAHERWGWGVKRCVAAAAVLLAVELLFLAANLLKVAQGGWFPLMLASGIFVLMATWRRGREHLAERIKAVALPIDHFLADIARSHPHRVAGTAVFMTGKADGTPLALLHNYKHNKVVHEHVILLNVAMASEPWVEEEGRAESDDLGEGFVRVRVRFGFKEEPNVPRALQHCPGLGFKFDPNKASFFLGRESLVGGVKSPFSRWRRGLFFWMSRNALPATQFFCIPPNRVVELGAQVEL